jgi:glyoxylase-like metal-dependent hydrolase (beta-lactamase superfamily II)
MATSISGQGRDVARGLPTLLRLTALALAVAGCGGPDADPDASRAPSAGPPAADLLRTANPYARGYTDDDFPRVQELAPGVYTYEQLRSAGDERFTTVSLFVVTGDGVLVADGQGSVEETRRLVDHIAEITDQPITTVVICSDHGDHTAGNSAFPADAALLAHPTSAANLRAGAAAAAGRDGAAPVVLPTELVEDIRVLEMGGTEIQVLFLGRAHTGGDLMVYLPEERILFMSEAYLHRVFPAMRSAYPSEWVATIERAQAMEVDVYVPGHGFVDAPEILDEELEAFRGALVQVIDEATRLHAQGLTLEEAQARASFGDLERWSLRASQGARAVQQVYAELNGELPGARP